MTRRAAFLATLALCGGAAAATAPLSAAAPYPPQPCPTHLLLTQSEGNYYLWLPNPTGTSCWISVEIPGNIKRPAAAAIGANGCPTQSPVYEANGHDYVIVPLNLDGNSPCGTPVELPVTVPPTF
jgi:hypothetical protein